MRYTDKKGFTLIELLIGMALSSIAIIIIIGTYTLQVRGKNTMEALTDMNQAARAALEIMTDEIRQAGLDPLGTANASITYATKGTLSFSLDRRSNTSSTNAPDGDTHDPNEEITYSLTLDTDDNGVNDDIVSGTECHLGRNTGGGLQPLARNVDTLNFVYLNAAGTAINLTPTDQTLRDSIRSIEITIVARAGQSSGGLFYSYVNNDVYRNLQDAIVLEAQKDAFRRLRLATTVQCRNMGL